MTPETLDEREFELVNIIGKQLGSNQRDLSTQMNLSLGQTNMLIRRLVAKGYIRITQLNQKKVQYLLTPKGIAEKLRKSVKYTLNTINSIGLINVRLKEILKELYDQGEREFLVVGKSDFALLIEMAFKDFSLEEYKILYADQVFPQHGSFKGVVLICREMDQRDIPSNIKIVDLIRELSKHDVLI